MLILGLFSMAFAEVVEPNDDFYYLDEADVLSEATEGEIFFCNELLEEACGAEIVIVAISTTGDMAIDDYTYTLFNEWEIGGSSTRGFLLLMAIDDDDYYAMPGTWLSSYFDSATIKDMLDTYLEPYFAEKDYDTGARLFFEAVFESVSDQLNLGLTIEDGIEDYNEYIASEGAQTVAETQTAQESQASESGAGTQKAKGGISMGIIILIIILIVILGGCMRMFRRRPHDEPPPGGGWGWGWRGPRVGRRPPAQHGPGYGGGGMNRGPGGGRAGGPGGGGRPSGGGMGSSGSRSGGFGGASRSGGSPSGPSTRGGGAGRGGRG